MEEDVVKTDETIETTPESSEAPSEAVQAELQGKNEIVIEKLNDTVVKKEVVLEVFEGEDIESLNTRLAQAEAAIKDLPNFMVRRLANLETERDELKKVISLLEGK